MCCKMKNLPAEPITAGRTEQYKQGLSIESIPDTLAEIVEEV